MTTLEAVFREHWGRVVAVLVGLLGDVDLAEDAAAEAFARAIAAQHAKPSTDWLAVAVLYAELAQLTQSPVVQLNRAVAVAVAEVDGPAVALRLVDTVPLEGYRYRHSTRADLLRRLGRTDEARAAYQRALGLTEDDSERQFQRRPLTGLEEHRS